MTPRDLALVGIGGAFGATARWTVVTSFAEAATTPVTLLVNVFGSMLAGALAARHDADGTWWPLAGLGFCGALTTFSTFTVDVASRLANGSVAAAGLLAFLTLASTVIAATAGYRLARDPRRVA